MNRIYLLIIVVLLSVQSHASIWRVNNTGKPADFSSLQAAHNAASSGDTIHIEGSPINYGELTCSKKMVIIGPGSFLSFHENTQANLNDAKVSRIEFTKGSEGSLITGVYIKKSDVSPSFSGSILIAENKISIIRCRTDNDIEFPSQLINNVIILQNYIGGSITSDNSDETPNDLIINNNIITNIEIGTNSSINNNIIRGTLSCSASTIRNNFFSGGVNGENNIITNNIASNNTESIPNSDGNQLDIKEELIFIRTPSGSPSQYYTLKPGSPAESAGYGGTDIGIFGGQTPYIPSLLPEIPTIHKLEVPVEGSLSDGIEIKIKASSN